MSFSDYVAYEASCPICGETLTGWASFDGPGECEFYSSVAELMAAANKCQVTIQCDHKCQGHWRTALAEFVAVMETQMVGEIQVIEW